MWSVKFLPVNFKLENYKHCDMRVCCQHLIFKYLKYLKEFLHFSKETVFKVLRFNQLKSEIQLRKISELYLNLEIDGW